MVTCLSSRFQKATLGRQGDSSHGSREGGEWLGAQCKDFSLVASFPCLHCADPDGDHFLNKAGMLCVSPRQEEFSKTLLGSRNRSYTRLRLYLDSGPGTSHQVTGKQWPRKKFNPRSQERDLGQCVPKAARPCG